MNCERLIASTFCPILIQEREDVPEYLALVAQTASAGSAGSAGKQQSRTGHDNPASPVYDVLEEPDYAELEGP